MPATLALHDSAALRSIEARATVLLGGESFELMRRAGRAAWHGALRNWPQAQHIVVVCGPGNNGGDGYVFARHALAAGRKVRVVRLPEHTPATPIAKRARDEYRELGGRSEAFVDVLPPADLIVDALFGIGFAREPEGAVRNLIEAFNAHPAPCFALDVPSGLSADRGSAPGPVVVAARTLEFIAAKGGLRTGAALEVTGRLELAELQLPPEAFDEVQPQAALLFPEALQQAIRPRRRNAHKGLSGRVLCLGGDHGSGGAIMLCADGALHAGAGLVEVATRELHVPALLARRPEAMARAVERSEELNQSLRQAKVVAIGPGLGLGSWGRVLFGAALSAQRPLVLDADALNLLATRKDIALPPDSILTPHPGEAARLLGTEVAAVQEDRFAAARDLAARFDAVVVLKGAGTIIAAPERTPAVIGAGNPGMAVAGMGDLLTGIIAGLRAQGMPAYHAACCGALMHAGAGDAAASEGGERGLQPSDLLAHVRRLANPEPGR